MDKCPTLESGQAGKADGCKGCPNAQICASAKPDDDIPLITQNLQHIKYIVAILSGKGGVGKSTISRNLASYISDAGYHTLILDFDLSGPSIPRLTKTEESFIFSKSGSFKPIFVDNRLSALSIGHLETPEDEARIFNSNVKNYAIKKILKNCDFSNIDVIVIGTPPNITDEHLALANYIKPNSAIIIIITTPQNIAFNDARRQIAFCKKTKIDILGLIENMKDFVCKSCNHKNVIFKDSQIVEYCKIEKVPYIGNIPLEVDISRSADSGQRTKNSCLEKASSLIIDYLEAKENESYLS